MESKSLLKLHELINTEIETCEMSALKNLSAASYYLVVWAEKLIDENEAKSRIIHHLTEAQSPPEWIDLIKDSL